MFSTVTDTIKTRKVAILAENGVRSPEGSGSVGGGFFVNRSG
jgi:hypothetical protein